MVQWTESYSVYRARYAGYLLVVAYVDNQGYKVTVTNGEGAVSLKERADSIAEGIQCRDCLDRFDETAA